MTIYEFNTVDALPGELYSVTPHEMVEKPKSYVGGGSRINKYEIDVLNGRRMYRLSDDPEPYISAMIEHLENSVKKYTMYLNRSKTLLDKWREV